MTFVLKLNTRRCPARFAGPGAGVRWEYRCGWCESSYRTAAELVAHVCAERAEGCLHFRCIICGRELPVSEGHALGSGSWICANAEPCMKIAAGGVPGG